MFKLTKERFKTFFLLLLITASIIQIGIHWNQQAQGFPFRFFAQFLNVSKEAPSMDVDALKSGYFIPEYIIASVDPTASQWKLDQNDSYFKSIWSDVKKNYLPSILKQKPDKVFDKEQWQAIISERCIRIDFAVNWPLEMVFWLENVNPGDIKGFSSVRSIAILPKKDANETVNTLYVYDENQVYQYRISIKQDFLPKEYYIKLLDEQLDNQSRPGFNILTKKFDIFKSDKDIYISLSNEWSSTYSTINVEIPHSIQLNRANIDNDNLQNNILLDQKESLVGQYDEPEGEAQFTDTENLYKYYSNGVLEYKYLAASGGNKGSASSAFNHALSFIELRRRLVGDAEIILTGIKPEDNYYVMQFDYGYKGVPVYYSGSGVNDTITPPLIIKANSERVLECKWVIRSFTETEKPRKYNLYFYNLIEKQIPLLYPEIVDQDLRKELYFNRIEPAYVFGLNDQNTLAVTPKWVISTESKDYYIPLMAEED